MTENDLIDAVQLGRRVLALLKDGNGAQWCQKYPARDAAGCYAVPNGERAVCWCITGAIAKESTSKYTGTSGYLLQALCAEIGKPNPPCGYSMPVAYWNDSHTYEEVIRLLETTIDKLEQKLLQAYID